MRALLPLLILTACTEAEPQADVPKGASIACAVDGADAFSDSCTVERQRSGARMVLTVSTDDGGFRRLEAGGDGTEIDTADGAAHARVGAGPAGTVEIGVDGDRYRLPASSR